MSALNSLGNKENASNLNFSTLVSKNSLYGTWHTPIQREISKTDCREPERILRQWLKQLLRHLFTSYITIWTLFNLIFHFHPPPGKLSLHHGWKLMKWTKAREERMTGGWLCYFILLSGKPSWRRWCWAETWWCHLNTGALTRLTLAPENRWGTSLQWPHIGNLKSATVGGFAYQKSANAMNQDIFFFQIVSH